MRVKTEQRFGFADSLIELPETELLLAELINWDLIDQVLQPLQEDYPSLRYYSSDMA